MNFSDWWRHKSAVSKKAVAESLQKAGYRCTIQHLRSIAQGKWPPGAKLAVAIEKLSEGAVTRHDLRPDLFPMAGCQCEFCLKKATQPEAL